MEQPLQLPLGGAWTLAYCLEQSPMPPAETWETVPAQVPGNVELDLARAGVEADPFWDENLYAYRKYEFYRWQYARQFELPAEMAGQRVALELEGVNTYAEVFLNGVPVGRCENMLIAHSFDVTGALFTDRPNDIRVVIRSAVNVARGREYPVSVSGGEHLDELVWHRMPPHCFGWDIMPRLPSAGIWRDIRLVAVAPTRIVQTYYTTVRLGRDWADLLCKYRFATDADLLEGFSVHVEGVCGDSRFEREQPALFVSGECTLRVARPQLWWPKGYGDQALYTVTLTLLHNGRAVDRRVERIGIRTVSIRHRMQPGEEGEFLIQVNGCSILAKGSNWVPLDAMHSRDAQRLSQAHALLDEAGCNIVRCWGGNVYEDHAFYDLCDARGMLVWQDFSMACAIYPQSSDFLEVIEREASSVIQKLRNHPCILLWAGDNEVDERYIGAGYSSASNRYNAITREVLPRAVSQHDPFRMFLPSSPYIPPDIARYEVPEQHNWGARAYFKDDFYKHTKAHFISECGYHGCPAPSSLAKFIPADKLWPYQNSAWDTHNTDNLRNVRRGYNRNQLMADQVAILFGKVPDNLEEFALLSQVSQAEAKKFFVERTRIKKWRRTGIIWWNLLDGWPQISDAVVDYYFVEKRAFRYLQRVQRPICLMLDELVDSGRMPSSWGTTAGKPKRSPIACTTGIRTRRCWKARRFPLPTKISPWARSASLPDSSGSSSWNGPWMASGMGIITSPASRPMTRTACGNG